MRPDFPSLHAQLQQHPHLTLQLVWEEYRQVHPEGYGYSRFCELYGRWRKKLDVVLRQEHKPGEKSFVDWAGATIPVHDPTSGEIWPASLFVNSCADASPGECTDAASQDESAPLLASLRENTIDFRAEVSQDGSRKLFVSPQDAALALEIVREITTGTPPT